MSLWLAKQVAPHCHGGNITTQAIPDDVPTNPDDVPTNMAKSFP